jgi:hypothetical protein
VVGHRPAQDAACTARARIEGASCVQDHGDAPEGDQKSGEQRRAEPAATARRRDGAAELQLFTCDAFHVVVVGGRMAPGHDQKSYAQQVQRLLNGRQESGIAQGGPNSLAGEGA